MPVLREIRAARWHARRRGAGAIFAAAAAVATAVGLLGCAKHPAAAPSQVPGGSPGSTESAAVAPHEDPRALFEQAERALGADQAARAVALFGRYLATDPRDLEQVQQAYLGLGRAHEMLRDCSAAITTYGGYLQRFPDADDRIVAWARKGACHAELAQWEASAASFREISSLPDQLPSAYVEALAREGYALFELGKHAQAEEVLARADETYERARADETERFASYYFVGMARFYRAAIVHLRFREVQIELPEKVMKERFERKMELLVKAQDAYNHTIEAKHMFWVSASGYQLGHLFGEFYDALMYAPVPEWLDAGGQRIYYEELEKQLQPVIEKAIWVFEKNLETARRFGYENQFTELTEAKLGHLQTIALSQERSLAQPGPRLVPELLQEVAPPQEAPGEPLPASERKLFVPERTPL